MTGRADQHMSRRMDGRFEAVRQTWTNLSHVVCLRAECTVVSRKINTGIRRQTWNLSVMGIAVACARLLWCRRRNLLPNFFRYTLESRRDRRRLPRLWTNKDTHKPIATRSGEMAFINENGDPLCHADYA